MKTGRMNRLTDEKSPYLKQHSNNPVNWYPWGKEALNTALEENKLLFISIGYSACHWCHVMERESFEDREIANVLNNHFISVKVDREERPDIDKSYMSAVQLMNGGGGWPLSCFATPEGKPFYGGTYYPRDQFLDILLKLAELWGNEPERIKQHASKLCEGIENSEHIKETIENQGLANIEMVIRKLEKEFDTDQGGFRRVPKFLTPVVYDFLLKYYQRFKHKSVLDHCMLTVDKVLNSGMYDQIGGGISRYSTDRHWFVPHFEKMLYDNSQFISLLAHMYCLTGDGRYREKIDECFRFTEGYLSNGEGGYFAALDADSEGEEGKYYTWKYQEIQEATGSDFRFIKEYFNLSTEGNWEDEKNILAVNKDLDTLSAETGIEPGKIKETLARTKRKLLEIRVKRISPGMDDKVITAWNALHLKAICDACQATGEKRYLDTATRSGKYILNNLVGDDGSLKRVSHAGIPGFLDDYAFVCQAFIGLYQLSFDEIWLNKMHEILEYTIRNFYDESTSMFFYSHFKEKNPVARQKEIMDSVIPSSNSVMASVLLDASVYFDDSHYHLIASRMILNVQDYMIQNPGFFANWASLSMKLNYQGAEVVLTGKRMNEYREGFYTHFLPDVIFAGAESNSKLGLFKGRIREGESRIYVCKNKTCQLPVEEVKDALAQLGKL